MSLANYSEFKQKVERDMFSAYWSTLTSGAAGVLMDTWRTAPSSGSVPATYRTCEYNTAGNLWQLDSNPNRGSTFYLAENGVTANTGVAAAAGILVDRLADQTGLVFNAASSQTTNLPLTPSRNTDGAGVMAALVCWTSAVSSALTGSITYTNTAGTSGRVSQSIVVSAMAGDQLKVFPLAAGDVGIMAVESFTVASSMAAAGVYGIVLFKPIAMFNLPNSSCPTRPDDTQYRNMLIGGGGALVPMPSCGCLDLFTINIGTAAVTLYGRTNWIEA